MGKGRPPPYLGVWGLPSLGGQLWGRGDSPSGYVPLARIRPPLQLDGDKGNDCETRKGNLPS
jgi:hypothetical protein